MLDPLADSAGNDIKNSVVSIQPNYTFRLKGFEQVKKAIVSGTFNNWNEDFFVMKRDKDGWFAHARVPLGKTHYKFIVDGKWINDPDNNLKELNEHNTFNSILWIKNDQ
jgi:ABC-type thiamine transport system substrate-binding protein